MNLSIVGRIDLEDLRFDEGQVGADVGADLRDFLLHALVGADPGVLVGHHAGVDARSGRSLSRCGCQAPARRRASVLTIQCSLERADARNLGDELVLRRPPRLVVGIDLRQVPPVFFGDLRPFLLLGDETCRGKTCNQREHCQATDELRHGPDYSVPLQSAPPVRGLAGRCLICPPAGARSWAYVESHRFTNGHRARPSQGCGSGPRARVLFRRPWVRADAADGSVGRLPECRRVPPPHRVEYMGEPGRPSTAGGHDRSVPLRHPLPGPPCAWRRAAPAARRGGAARRRERPRRERSALPARPRRQRPRTVLGSPARAVAEERGWIGADDDRPAGPRVLARGGAGNQPTLPVRSRRMRS